MLKRRRCSYGLMASARVPLLFVRKSPTDSDLARDRELRWCSARSSVAPSVMTIVNGLHVRRWVGTDEDEEKSWIAYGEKSVCEGNFTFAVLHEPLTRKARCTWRHAKVNVKEGAQPRSFFVKLNCPVASFCWSRRASPNAYDPCASLVATYSTTVRNRDWSVESSSLATASE